MGRPYSQYCTKTLTGCGRVCKNKEEQRNNKKIDRHRNQSKAVQGQEQ